LSSLMRLGHDDAMSRSFLLTGLVAVSLPLLPVRAEFRAGVAITDVTPKELPVFVNGSMRSRSVDKVKTPVSARSLAFTDGEETIVLVVVDSCMMPRDLLDKAKAMASEKCGVPTEHILISATHTHTAPSCMGALGTDADPAYVLFLTKRLVDAILAPLEGMKPARVGWGEVDAADYTAVRRWVLRPDRMREDPFGNLTVRANMHAATDWDNAVGKTGPEDPMLSLISVQTADGRPLGLLANFSMHYFGDRDISADYFGLFANELQDRLDPEGESGFVAMMSHGCSGDIWRHDYEKSPDRASNEITIEEYATEMTALALGALEEVTYHVPETIAMSETRMTLDYRLPDRQRLEWARRVVEETGDRPPGNTTEVYAREAVLLDEKKRTEIVVQGLRIGEQIAIATTPNETYAITGLKIKAASPVKRTMVIELANGGDGYIPPPEQHLLGGYNTWPARTAGLEVEAEPKITEAAIALLEEVSGKSRGDRRSDPGPAVSKALEMKPRAYWRLEEFAGPRAIDASPNHLDAIYEPRVLFYLAGPDSERFSRGGVNRAAHFAGDRLEARIPGLGDTYSISLWFWNGMPVSAREETGWIFSRGRDHGRPSEGDHLGIGGTAGNAGGLIFRHGHVESVGHYGIEPSATERWTWHHLAFVRDGETVHVFLDGKHLWVYNGRDQTPPGIDTIYFGGRCDDVNNFEGRLDEIAVFDRALTSEEIEILAGR